MAQTLAGTRTLGKTVIDHVGTLSPTIIRIIAFVAIIAVGVADRLTGPSISFLLFYVVPIAFVSWYGGIRFGLLCALMSAGLVLWGDLALSPDMSPFVHLWNTTVRLLNFTAVAVLFHYVRTLYQARVKYIEDKYTRIVESAIEGIIATDLDGKIQFVNTRAATILGYMHHSTIGHHVYSFISHAPSRGEMHKLLDVRTQPESPFEIQFTHSTGRPVWVWVNATVSKNDQGVVDGMVLLLTDISERKKAEDAFHESERNFRMLVERMKEGLLRVDGDDRIQFVNQEFCDIVGYSKEELMGREAGELLLSREWKALLKEKNALRREGIADIYEIQLQTKSRGAIWVRVSGAPVTDPSGKIVGSIGVHTDITLQKVADEELRRRYEEISATHRLSSVLVQSMDLDRRLEAALDTVLDVMKFDGGTIFMLDETGKDLILQHPRGLSPGIVEMIRRWPVGKGTTGKVALTGTASFIANAHDSSEVDLVIRETENIVAMAVVPLESKGKVVGVMSVLLHREHEFSENEKAMLQAFGKQIGIAVENATLYETAKEREKQVRRLSIDLVKVQEDERKRFARELHDGLSQVLTTLKINTELAAKNFRSDPIEAERHLQEALNLTDEAQNEAKQLAYDLRPAILDDFGLKAALAVLVSNFERRTGITAEFISPIPDVRFDSLLETSVYRIAQELLANVAKHAHASKISIQFLLRDNVLVVDVADNGRGLASASTAARSKGGIHFGLRNIRERIEFFGGTFRTESFENRGTEVMIELPVGELILPLQKQTTGA